MTNLATGNRPTLDHRLPWPGCGRLRELVCSCPQRGKSHGFLLFKLPSKLLAALSNADLALLQPHLEPVELEVRRVLELPNKPIKHSLFHRAWARFDCRGQSSQAPRSWPHRSEGMTGLPIVLGNDRSPHENFIQVAGEGSRIPADKLREASDRAARSKRRFSSSPIPS